MKIQEIKNDLAWLGNNDNINLAALLYLSLSMRKTKRRISVLVTGPTGAGKSHLIKSVMDMFPQEDIITVSRMTPAALIKQGDLSEKVLFVYEKFKDDLFAQYIRELISEGEVVYSTVNQIHSLKGPTTLIETTVNPNIISIENKSRCFAVGINTSAEARKNILERQKMLQTVEGLRAKKTSKERWNKHRKFQQNLDPTIAVVIPFANRIKFISLAQHVSRIFDRISNVISAIAYLEQGSRDIKEIDGGRYIEAIEEDFHIVKTILQNLPIDESESVLQEDTIEFIEILRSNREALIKPGNFTRAHVFDLIRNSHYPYKSSKIVIKHLSMLGRMGFLNEVPIRGLKNRCEYSFGALFPMGLSGRQSRNCYATLCLT